MESKSFRLMLRLLVVLGALCPLLARAEATELRIAHQLGLGYLQIYVMQGKKLVEKYARKEGIKNLTVMYKGIGSPAILNDGILSGRLDMVTAGPPPFLNIWDRTKGTLNVKMLAALNMQPMRLNTSNPAVKTVCDFSEKDRIAVPGVKTSMHAILLDMAAKKCGKSVHFFDALEAPLSHPDAAIALTSGKSIITGHFATIPYDSIELQDPNIHTVITSYDLTGGPSIVTGIWLSQKFYDANPKIVRAVYQALEESTKLIKSNPQEAAKIYLKLERTPLNEQQVVKILGNPNNVYTLTPHKIMVFAKFMHSLGLLKNEPASWKELFFPMIYSRNGS